MKSLFIGIGLVLIGLLVFGCTQAQPPLVGGDKDVHGCIGSAGYSWCEAKQKCLRIWEENCTAAVSAKGECAATGCHGCRFSSESPAMCTLEWRPEYSCDKYIQCGVVNDECVQVNKTIFNNCLSCVNNCNYSAENTDFDCPQKC